MLKSIKAVGFDLDGTLVNSLPGLAAAIDAMLASANLPTAGQHNVARWIGNGANILVERALNWANIQPTDRQLSQFRETFDRYYADTVEQGSQLYPNVLETLELLHLHKIKMALVTNKPSQFVPSLLQQLNLTGYFNTIVGGDDVIVKKPHPAPIYLILAKLGLRAEELVFVGDSRNDIEAGRAAQCPTIGLTYGYNYGESIALSQPDYVIEQFSDILPLIGISH